MMRPSFTDATIPPSPASVRTIPAADLATSVAVENRDAHLRLAQRRGIVSPVTAHPNGVAALLKSLNQVILVVGKNAGQRPRRSRTYPVGNRAGTERPPVQAHRIGRR